MALDLQGLRRLSALNPTTMKRNVLLILATSFVILTMSFYQAFDLKSSIARGKGVYESQCMSCHMAEGEGLAGVFPPVAKADYMTDKNRLVKVILIGVRGPMKVNGVAYDGEMAGTSLTDEEVSDVINYMQNSWGNKGAAVLPSEIQPAMKANSKNYQPF